MDKNRMIEILKKIQYDMKADAKHFDGQPFNGKTVATYFGYHGAAIAGIANILKEFIEANDQ